MGGGLAAQVEVIAFLIAPVRLLVFWNNDGLDIGIKAGDLVQVFLMAHAMDACLDVRDIGLAIQILVPKAMTQVGNVSGMLQQGVPGLKFRQLRLQLRDALLLPLDGICKFLRRRGVIF